MNKILDYQKLAADITEWIRDYTERASISGLVIGVSGGIDSAVVSTLCTLTGIPTYCCSIAIRSSEEHLNLAKEHMIWLKENYHTSSYYMNLDHTFIELKRAVPFDSVHGWANTKSRLRMTVLYQVAATVNGLVVGTGNKVEDFGVGFCTKWGDSGVDISPIGDLTKTQVRELGRYLGISDKILNAHPTDGLWEDGRTDHDQIKATYEELEWVMNQRELYERHNFHSDIVREPDSRQQEVLDIYDKFHNRNLHKILPIPVYKLTQDI